MRDLDRPDCFSWYPLFLSKAVQPQHSRLGCVQPEQQQQSCDLAKADDIARVSPGLLALTDGSFRGSTASSSLADT